MADAAGGTSGVSFSKQATQFAKQTTMFGRQTTSMTSAGGGTTLEDMDTLSSQTLQFGDFVVFEDHDRTGGPRGIVHAPYSTSAYSGLAVKQSPLTDPNLGDNRMAVFQIIPQRKYKAAKRFREAVHELQAKYPRRFVGLSTTEVLSVVDRTLAKYAEEEGGSDSDSSDSDSDDDEAQRRQVAAARPKKLQDRLTLYEKVKKKYNLAQVEHQGNTLEAKKQEGDTVHYGMNVQLLNMFANRLVHTSPEKTGILDPNNLRVDLSNESTRHCWFRLMPFYRLRSEGDAVRMGDRIMFESVKAHGQYLHTSDQSTQDYNNPFGGLHEVNLSAEPSPWTLYPFKKPDEPGSAVATSPQPVKAYSVVQLQHKEHNAYLSAEGCAGEVMQDVHLRVRKPEAFTNKYKNPTTAVTFWQIEPCDVAGNVIMRGEPLQWDAPVRLRHLPTQMFLSLSQTDGAPSFGLKEIADTDSMFVLRSVFADDETVSAGDYARLQHFVTDTWVHASGETVHRAPNSVTETNESTPELVDRLRELRWDTSKLTRIAVNDAQAFVDAFVISPVESFLARPTSFVAGCIPVLRRLKDVRTSRVMTDTEAEDCISALRDIKRFQLDIHGNAIKSRQKLLRNFGIVDLLVGIVESHLFPNHHGATFTVDQMQNKASSNCQRVIMAVFDCLAFGFLMGHAKKNELYVSRYMPLFQLLLGTPVKVELMYTELLDDNSQMIDLIGRHEIQTVVSHLRPDKRHLSAGILQLLAAVCVDSDIPRLDRQQIVLETLMSNQAAHKLVCELRLDNDKILVDIDDKEIDLLVLQEEDPVLFEFVQAQLDLFGKLCAGRHVEAVQATKQHLPFELCFFGASSPTMPYEIRAEFTALLLTLFVDEAPNVDVLSTVQLSYDVSTLTALGEVRASAAQAVAMSGATNQYFAQLKEFLLRVLRNCFGMIDLFQDEAAGDERQDALGGFMMEVLNLLLHLVRFGYYDDDDDIRDLAEPLWATLIVHHEIATRQKQLTSEKTIRANLRALEVLDALMNFSTRWRLKRVLRDFYVHGPLSGDNRAGYIDVRSRLVSRAYGAMAHAAASGRDRLASFRRGSHIQPEPMEIPEDEDDMPCLPGVDRDTIFSSTGEVRAYIEALVRMSSWSTPTGKRVTRWIPDRFLDAFVDSQYISPSGPSHLLLDIAGEYKNPGLSREALIILKRINSPAEELLDYAGRALLLDEPTKPADGLVQLSTFLFRRVPSLRLVSTGRIDSSTAPEFIDDISRLTIWATSDGEPVPMAQGVILSWGVADLILDTLLVEDGQPEDVLIACLDLMATLANGNEQVQEILFDNLDQLLKVRCQPGDADQSIDLGKTWAEAFGRMLQQLFVQNLKLCLHIKRGHVSDMIKFIEDHGHWAHNVFIALESLIRVELPEGFEKRYEHVKRNQQMIMKYIMRHHATVVLPGLIGDRTNETMSDQRAELLSTRDESNPALRYHLSLISLYSACCAGDATTQFIESMTQTALHPQQVLDVILDEAIDLQRRRVYIRMFLWVFTKTTVRNPELRKLLTEPRVWDALDRIGADLLFRSELQSDPTYRLITFQEYIPWMHYTADMARREQADNRVIVDRLANLAESVVRYKDFCANTLSNSERHSLLEGLASVRQFLARAEMNFSDVRATLKAVRQAEEQLAHLPSMPASPARRPQDNSSSAEKSKQLRDFVKLLLRSYRGKNKVKHQFPIASSRSREPYTEHEDEDEALPLGPEFQNSVRWFVKYNPNEEQTVVLHGRIQILVTIINMHLELRPERAQDRREQDDLTVMAMQILRAIIHNEALLAGSEGQVFAPADLCKKPFEVCLPLMNILSLDNQVAREGLACIAAILADYNPVAQRLYLKFFRSTREERFFLDISRRIDAASEHMNEVRTLLKQLTASQPTAVAKPMVKGPKGLISRARGKVMTKQVSGHQNPLFDPEAADTSDSLPLRFSDESRVELVLRIIQKLCEGHYSEMQDYMRMQPDNFRQIDLVAKSVQVFQTLAPQVNAMNIELTIQAVATLTELASGNGANQERVFKARCLESVNEIIRNEYEPKTHWLTATSAYSSDPDQFKPLTVAKLKLGCGKLVLSLIENSDALATQLAQELRTSIDIRYIFINMQLSYNMHEQLTAPRWAFGAGMDKAEAEKLEVLKDTLEAIDRLDIFLETLHEMAFTYLHILERIFDLTGVDYHLDPVMNPFFVGPKPDVYEEGDDDPELEIDSEMNSSVDILSAKKQVIGAMKDGVILTAQAHGLLKKDSTSIEILRDDEVQRVHFHNPYRNLIRESTKERLKWAVNRDSPQSKIDDFDTRSRIIIEDIQYGQRLKRNWRLLYYLLTHSAWWSRLLLLMTFVINVLILAVWDAPRDWTDYEPVVEHSWYDAVITILGIVHLVASGLVCLTYYVVTPPSVFSTLNALPIVGPELVITYNTYVKRLHWLHLPRLEEDTMTRSPLFSLSGLFHLLLPVFSVLGIVFHGYFFGFHLLYIIVDNDILLRVLSSVTKNGDSLLAVAGLMIVVIYLYALASFAFLRHTFDEAEGAFCQTAFQCFVTSVKFGLMSGGGLGEALPSQTYGFEEPGVRVLFDLSFFIIINIVALNVVFGIIVDTFSELRDEKFQASENMANQCFICSLPSDDFDRANPPTGFLEHISREHHMWDYVCFILYLKDKDKTDLSAHEEYVWGKWQEKNTSWYPQKRALLLDAEVASDETKVWQATVSDKLQQLLDRVEGQIAKQTVQQRVSEGLNAKFNLRQSSTMGVEAESPEADTVRTATGTVRRRYPPPPTMRARPARPRAQGLFGMGQSLEVDSGAEESAADALTLEPTSPRHGADYGFA
eukprot:m.350531 g.350531  ORF g.350531 m.350531 type:complete len:2826 (+) comp19889_c0_seq3:203-8680(+)